MDERALNCVEMKRDWAARRCRSRLRQKPRLHLTGLNRVLIFRAWQAPSPIRTMVSGRRKSMCSGFGASMQQLLSLACMLPSSAHGSLLRLQRALPPAAFSCSSVSRFRNSPSLVLSTSRSSSEDRLKNQERTRTHSFSNTE